MVATVTLTMCESNLFGADFEGQFETALAWVNQAAQTHLKVSLEVRALNEDETKSITSQSISASPFAVYDRKRNRLIVNPNACRVGLFVSARNVAEMDDMLLVLFVHELLHAYQATIIDEKVEGRIPPRLLRCICEGHAMVFSETIAKSHGLATSIADRICPPNTSGFDLDPNVRRARMLQLFTYTIGSRFVSRNSDDVRQFKKLLEGNVTYETICTGEHREATTRQASSTNSLSPKGEAVTAKLAELAKTEVHATAEDITSLDYLDAMAVVAPCCFDLLAVSRAFQGAMCVQAPRSDSGIQRVYIITFNEAQVTKDVFDKSSQLFRDAVACQGGSLDLGLNKSTWCARTRRHFFAATLRGGSFVFIEGNDLQRVKGILEKLN